MLRRYFVAEGELAERTIREARDLLARNEDTMSDLLKKYGADTAYVTRDGIASLAWKDAASMPDGFVLKEKRREGDIVYLLGRCDLRRKVGKDAKKDIAAFKRFTIVDYAADVFGVKRSVFGMENDRHVLAHTGGGVAKEKLVFIIPFTEDEEYPPPMEKFQIPACFREIKKSEWIALTEE